MSRVLAYTSPARGHLFPLVHTLEELCRRGHEISVRTLATEVERMRGLGFATEPIDPAIEQIHSDDYLARTRFERGRRIARTFTARAAHDAEDLRRAIEAERPDVMLVDLIAWGAATAAEASGVPWALTCPTPVPLPAPETAVPLMGLKPRRRPARDLRDWLARRLFLRPLNGIAMPVVNELRLGFGLAPLDSVWDIYLVAPLFLAYSARPLEYERPGIPSVRLVGPGRYDPQGDVPSWLPNWLQTDRAPLVVVATSTERLDDRALIATALEAMEGEEVRLVVTAPQHDAADFQIPANAQMEQFIPLGPLFEQASALVCHGGFGVTQKALLEGVPVCVVPFARDQPEIARRVEASGAGIRLPPRRLNPRHFRKAVRKTIARRDSARRVGAELASVGGPQIAADNLEALLASGIGRP